MKKLMGYQVTRGPRDNFWLMVDPVRKIEFRQYTQSERADPDEKKPPQVRRSTMTFELRASGASAEKDVDDYVNEALDYYKGLKVMFYLQFCMLRKRSNSVLDS